MFANSDQRLLGQGLVVADGYFTALMGDLQPGWWHFLSVLHLIGAVPLESTSMALPLGCDNEVLQLPRLKNCIQRLNSFFQDSCTRP